jgi:hypothetical protein
MGAYASGTPSATSADTIVRTGSSTNLSPAGGVQTTVLTALLPASTTATHRFVIHAQGDFVNFAASDYTRCSIAVNGNPVAGVAAMVGDPNAPGAWGPAAFVMPFSLVAGVTVPRSSTPSTATLQCDHDNSSGATPYVDADASMLIHKTASLTNATE